MTDRAPTKTPFALWLEEHQRRLGIEGRTEFAQVLTVDQSLLTRWLDKGITPSPPNLRKVATALGVPAEEVLRIAGHLAERAPTTAEYRDLAGAGTAHPINGEPLPDVPDRDLFDVKVTGDCLEPEIQPGDRLEMSRSKRPYPGAIVSVLVDGTRQIKRVEERKGRLLLVSKFGVLSVEGAQVEGVMTDGPFRKPEA